MHCARKPTSVKQPKWHSLSTSSTACWRWDARATSASYETTRTGDHCVHRLIHATRSIFGRKRLAVMPSDILAQMKGQCCLVFIPRPVEGEIRHDRAESVLRHMLIED